MSDIEKALDATLDLASETQRLRERVAQLEAEARAEKAEARVVELEAMLRDPEAVRANLLRGTIASPPGLAWLGDSDGPVAELRARAEKAERERDEVWRRFSIESDESLLECVERTVNGWRQRAEKAEARVVEQAREWAEVNDALAKELDRTSRVERERDEANNEINRWSSVTRELRQKLAIAGVEGSPPPGGGETTIGALFERARKAEQERDELTRRYAAAKELLKADEECITTAEAERDAARAEAAMLREALVELCEAAEFLDGGRYGCELPDARAALAASPGDWLAARDRALAERVREACAGIARSVMWSVRGAEAIQALDLDALVGGKS